MKRALSTVLVLIGALFCFMGVSPASAATVNYTVDGIASLNFAYVLNNGYPSDTVEIQSYTGTLDLTPGTVIQQVNTVAWTVDYSASGNSPGTFTAAVPATRDIHFSAVTGTLSQNGTLSVLPSADTLAFALGSTTTLTVNGWLVSITPLALGPWVRSSLGTATAPLTAEFVISQTPLPAALPLFATGLGSLGLLGWRRKKKAAVLTV